MSWNACWPEANGDGNARHPRRRLTSVMNLRSLKLRSRSFPSSFLSVVTVFAFVLAAMPLPADSAAEALVSSAQSKLDRIVLGEVEPGGVITFSTAEMENWGRAQLPASITDFKVDLKQGRGSVHATIDFLALAESDGRALNPVFAAILEGKRPLDAVMRIDSAPGFVIATIEEVTLSGVPVSGTVLNFLIDTFVTPNFPEARFNEPVPLEYGLERVQVHSGGITAYMKGSR